jgi:hypothetical protein
MSCGGAGQGAGTEDTWSTGDVLLPGGLRPGWVTHPGIRPNLEKRGQLLSTDGGSLVSSSHSMLGLGDRGSAWNP